MEACKSVVGMSNDECFLVIHEFSLSANTLLPMDFNPLGVGLVVFGFLLMTALYLLGWRQ